MIRGIFNVRRVFGFISRDKVINQSLRNKPEVVYGARAMNIQLPPGLQRHTIDYDIYSKTPKKKAKQLERKLDRDSSGNFFYTKEALHKGTYKVMDVGFDNKKGTRDDFGVIDLTKPDRKIKKVKIDNINYAHISERERDAKRSLSESEFHYRHEKDRRDLHRIRYSKKIWRI